MEPKLKFTVTSLTDEIPLDCRLYFQDPKENDCSSYIGVCGAIIAHPYAPLGGSYDDPVVEIIVSELFKRSHIFVCTFNFRGAYGSAGRTSWTGRSERGDYESIVYFMAVLLRQFGKDMKSYDGRKDVETTGIRLILGGYSYGSWIASHIAEPSELCSRLQNDCGVTAAGIRFRAAEITAQVRDALQRSLNQPVLRTTTVGCGEHSADKRHRGHGRFSSDLRRSMDLSKRIASGGAEKRSLEWGEGSELGVAAAGHASVGPNGVAEEDIMARYLLVSPLLPPISTLAAMPLGSNPLKSLSAEQLCREPSIAVFGDDGSFTSIGKLRTWVHDLSSKPASKFHAVEVGQAGHFWSNIAAQKLLRQAIREWLASW